jgi:hypothetical protein
MAWMTDGGGVSLRSEIKLSYSGSLSWYSTATGSSIFGLIATGSATGVTIGTTGGGVETVGTVVAGDNVGASVGRATFPRAITPLAAGIDDVDRNVEDNKDVDEPNETEAGRPVARVAACEGEDGKEPVDNGTDRGNRCCGTVNGGNTTGVVGRGRGRVVNMDDDGRGRVGGVDGAIGVDTESTGNTNGVDNGGLVPDRGRTIGDIGDDGYNIPGK